MNRIALGILGVLAIILILVVFVLRGNDEPETATNTVQLKSLEQYAEDENSQVKYTTRGAINGDDIHREIAITVTSGYRQLDIIQGYEGNIINRQTYTNNQNAYKSFLSALKRAGFTTKSENSTSTDPAGQCSTGRVFYYDLSSDSEALSNLWSGSCSRKIGTFGGNPSTVQTLFQAQITDYSKITSGVSLQ